MREKLEKGIRESLEKRPITETRFHTLITRLERDIQKKARRRGGDARPEITSADIGEVVMRRLKQFDKVGYIRFASVYRQFEDVETFQRELKKLERKRKKREEEQKPTLSS